MKSNARYKLGQNCYDSYVYFNFDEEEELKSVFEKNKNPHRIVELLSLIAECQILPQKTLIIFASWIQQKNPDKISQIQEELVSVYENDFSKHNGKVSSGRILMVFRSIVTQLAKENEKFMYGAVREGGRARDFEEAIEWLVSAGMLNRVYNVSKTEHPIAAFDRLRSPADPHPV